MFIQSDSKVLFLGKRLEFRILQFSLSLAYTKEGIVRAWAPREDGSPYCVGSVAGDHAEDRTEQVLRTPNGK